MKKITSVFISLFLLFTAVLLPIKSVLASSVNTLSCAGYTVKLRSHSVGLINLPSLKLDEPQVIATDIDNSCAVVVWNTNSLSTSQVIFAKDGEPKTLDLLDSDETTFWGYAQGSAQNAEPQVHHVMIINNLDKGAKYYLRAVSRPVETALPYTSKEIVLMFNTSGRRSVTGDNSISYNYDYINNLNDNSTNNSTNSQSGTQQTAHTNTYVSTPTAQYYHHNKGGQKNMAKSINRIFASANSKGKFDFEKFPTKYSGTSAQETTKDDNVNVSENTQTDKETASSTEGAEKSDELVEVIGAANAGDSLKPFWQKIKDWFTSLFTSSDEPQEGESEQPKYKPSAENNQDNAQKDSDDNATGTFAVTVKSIHPDGKEEVVATSSDVATSTSTMGAVSSAIKDNAKASAAGAYAVSDYLKNIFSKMGVFGLILPILLIIGVLYFIQKAINASFEAMKDRSLYYWMIAFAIFAVFFALLKVPTIALTFLALFLIALAWHLFNIAVSDLDADENQLVENAQVANVDKS